MARYTRVATFAITFVGVLSVLQRSLASDVDTTTTPVIENGEKELILPKGSTRRLGCQSHQPILWVHAEGWLKTGSGIKLHEETDLSENQNGDKLYQVRKLLSNVSAETVGFYYCIHRKAYEEMIRATYTRTCNEQCANALDELLANNQASAIYVYVDDPEQPLMPIKQSFFFVDQYDSLILPCKPTQPKVQVELIDDFKEDLVEEFQYTMTQGFRLFFNGTEDDYSYICQVKGKPTFRFIMQVNINKHSDNSNRPNIIHTEDAPEFVIEDTMVTLPKGSSKNFTCKCHRPCLWTFYAPSHRWEPPNVGMNYFRIQNTDKSYGAMLMLLDVSAETVGRYFCVYRSAFLPKYFKEKLDEHVATYKASSVYVYVNDPDQPLVPMNGPIPYDRQLILPCKPTSPGVEVELFNAHEQNVAEYFHYNATEGYQPKHELPRGDAFYYCQVKGKPKLRTNIVVMDSRNLDDLGNPWTALDHDFEHVTPIIYFVQKEVIIPKNVTNIFICVSQQPILWLCQVPSNHRIRVVQYVVNIPETHFVAVLVLSYVSVELVGRYYCVHRKDYENLFEKALDDLMENYQTSSLYVYVEDPEQPLVPLINSVFSVKRYESIILPCKPTSPGVEVELYKGPNMGLITDEKYTVTQGYRIYFNSYKDDESYYSQVRGKPDHRIKMEVRVNLQYKYSITRDGTSHLMCHAASWIVQDGASFKLSAEHLSNRTIDSDTRHVVLIGGRVRLVCKVTFLAGISVDMTWITPAKKNTRIKAESIHVKPVHDSTDRYYALHELVIDQATLADNGTYRCEVNDQHNHTFYKNYTLSLAKPIHGYVELSAGYNRNYTGLNSNENESPTPINIAIEYWSFSLDISYYWQKTDDLKLSEHNIARYKGKYEVTRTNTHMMLKISNPTVLDTGNYTLYVIVENDENSRQIGVLIYAKPNVEMDSKFVKPGQNVTFSCHSIGYPRPEISFLFVPCTDEPWRNCSMPISKKSTRWDLSHLGKTESSISERSTYTLHASQPGVIYCRAKNSEGVKVAQADLLISPFSDAITLQQVRPTTTTITVGDRAVIVCSALVYNYTNDITLELKGRELVEADGVKMGYSKEMFAWQANLTIDSITHEHAGDLYCKVKTVENNIESRVINLKILDRAVLYLVSGDLNESIPVSLNSPLQLTCDVDGTREPTIVWYKNNKEIIINETETRMAVTKQTLTYKNLTIKDLGEYRCRATSENGTTEKRWIVNIDNKISSPATPKISDMTPPMIYGIIGLLTGLIIVIALVSLLYCNNMKKMRAIKREGIERFTEGNLDVYNPEQALDGQADLLPYKTEYEFPKERLKFGKQLGAGEFGVVTMATATRIMVHEDETTVAVKMVKKQTDNEVMRALISELKIMVHLGQHLNVVNLLGAVTKNIVKRELMVIVEYCRYGNVQSFIRKHRPYFIDQINEETQQIDSTNNQHRADCDNQQHGCEPMQSSTINMGCNGAVRSLNTTDLVCWASQIASGMEYLASRKVLHGDLATRNILLCDDNVVKICDFGLSRSMYKTNNYKKKGEGPLPFKWLALECISDNVFSTYSDVWAYGIVLWELFSLAKVPYPGMEPNQELYKKLNDGYRMDMPQYSNRDIYDIMLNCWNVKPDSRPSFKDLKSKFNAMLPEEMWDHYMKLNAPYLQMNEEKVRRGDIDYLAYLGTPEELAPTVPNNGIGEISPLSPNEGVRRIAFTSFGSERHSPTISNNLYTTRKTYGRKDKTKRETDEIPMCIIGGSASQSTSTSIINMGSDKDKW